MSTPTPINTKNINVKYLTLASGLNFKVLEITITSNGVLEIDLIRYSKSKGGQIESRLIVTAGGAYLPNGELNNLDVVSISDGVSTYITPAGLAHQSRETQNIHINQLNTYTKIQTRNGIWYNCLGAYPDYSNNTILLQLNMVGSESRIRTTPYKLDGKHDSDHRSAFSPYDIVRIEQLG